MFTLQLLVGLCALLLAQLLRTRWRRHLSKIPGPLLASFSNLWKIKAVYDGDMPRRNILAHATYGPVVRIGPNHVSFASPEALKVIYGARPTFPKSNFYKPTAPSLNGKRLDNLFSLQDVDYHATLKKNLMSLYTKTIVTELEPRINDTIILFIHRLDEEIAKGSPVLDMSLWLHYFAFDSLGDFNLSKRFGFLDRGQDVGNMLETADRILHMTGLYGQSPWLQDLQLRIKARWTKTRPNPLLLYAVSEVNQRLKTATTHQDMLNKFIALRETDASKVSADEIAGAIYINLMAGHDVLAITLRAILHHLCTNPTATSKLRAEIDTIYNTSSSSPRSSSSSSSNDSKAICAIPYAELSSLPYLDATLHESLRVHANTGLILERVVPAGGATIDGYYVPEGTIVGVNGWVIHRNAAIFGDGVDAFRPERWLGVSRAKQAEMKRHIFSFGDGARKCIGQNIAMAQATKVVVELIRRYDFEREYDDWHVHGSWVTKQSDMKMRVTRREKGE